VISWGAQGGTGGAFVPPSLYVKKGPALYNLNNKMLILVGLDNYYNFLRHPRVVAIKPHLYFTMG
jgi:hypothetical protein